MMLEQEIEKYLSGQTLCNCDSVSYRNIKNLILGFAEPREKRIAELTEYNETLMLQIQSLGKENAELEKENEMFKKANEIIAQQRDDRDADISILENRIEELDAQIEKMKCCGNCAKRGHICVAEEMQGNLCSKNKDKWEMKEK